MSSNMVFAVIGALLATTASIASALVFIIASSKNAGRREGKLDDAIKKLDIIDASLEKIPTLEIQIGQHGTLIETIRSDIRQLKNQLPGDVQIRPRYPSNPRFDDEK